MSVDWTGAIDCDFHPRAPTPRALGRYMDEHWRDTVQTRGIDVWESIAYPANSPLTMRPDWRESRADAAPVSAAQATLIWVATQPMEEPRDRRQLLDMMEWIGWDRLLFCSDYPHWDFDDPFRAFPAAMPRERARQILTTNAKAVYRLG